LNSEQRKEVCALVCMSIEHPKGRCPSTSGISINKIISLELNSCFIISVRAVTLASRYLIQSNGN